MRKNILQPLSSPVHFHSGTPWGSFFFSYQAGLPLKILPQLLPFSHSVMSNSVLPHGARQASPYFTFSQSLLKLMSIESVMPSNYLILCHSLFFLPSVFPNIRVFSSESAVCIRWPKCYQLQHQFFQRIFRADFLQEGLVGSLCSPRGSHESSPTPQFKIINSSVLSFLFNSHIHTWLLEKP